MKHLSCLLILLCTSVQADYSAHPKAAGLIDELVGSGHYSKGELLRILREARQNPKLIETEQKAPEKTRTWPEYRAIFLDDWRIRKGAEYLRTHRETFARAQASYGIPPALVAAIIGVETRYGGYTGPHRVLDSLATQGFDHPTRSTFFFSELKHFLLLCKEHGFDPLQLQGSYAGAMGLSQFMPSNYRHLGLDYDANGAVDLWDNHDAIGSAANYLVNFQSGKRAWQANQSVAFPVQVRTLDGIEINSKYPQYRWGDLKAQISGLAVALDDEQAVGLIELDLGASKAYWLGLPNFYSIMSYNPRVYYAMAVFQLSEAIAAAALQSTP